MGHVQDRWFTTQHDTAIGKDKRVKTAQYGKGMRYKVRYLDPDGRERSKCFPDKCKKQADDFKLSMESDQRSGRYVDPDAGKTLLRDYAENWIKGQAADLNSRATLRQKVNSRILAYLGSKPLSAVEKPATIRDWLDWLRSSGTVSENYAEALYRTLSGMLESAVSEKLIHNNPCRAKGISRPRHKTAPAVAWDPERLTAIREAVPDRERIAVDLGVGLGLRFGEILGLSPDDVDDTAGVVHVRRQVRKVKGSGALVFSLPKRGKLRDVPLSPDLAALLQAYLAAFPAQPVTLPWKHPGGQPVTHTVFLSRPGGRTWDASGWSYHVWDPTFRRAGLTKRRRIDGIHALRHTYASLLLADGVSVRELATYLGHDKLSFTLEIYTHMLPSSHQRAQAAVTGFLRNHIAAQPPADGLQAA